MAFFVQLLPLLVSLLSPLVTAGVKKLVPRIPKALVPLVSVSVGTAAGYVLDFGAANGAIAGAVGVAVREVLDQAQKALVPNV